MPPFLRFPKKTSDHYKEFSVHKSLRRCEFNIHSIDHLREHLLKRKPKRYPPLVALLGSGLRHRVMIISDGEEWRRTHQAIDSVLQAGVMTNRFASMVQQVAQDAFAPLVRSSSGEGQAAASIAVEPLMRTVTLSILAHPLFGQVLPLQEAERLQSILTAATAGMKDGIPARMNLGLGAILGAFNLGERQPVILPRAQRRAADELLRWIAAKIDQLASPRPPLLQGLEERYSEMGPADRKRCIAGEYAMLFIAGIETTAAALTLAIAEVANHPAVLVEVTREARKYTGMAAPSTAVGSATAQFPYIHMVWRETLRRHTIVPTLLRETEEEYVVQGVKAETGSTETVRIPKGSTLRYLPMQGHMRHGIWTDPHQFDPSRFARPLSFEQSKHYIPFGFGPQRCPGHSMATTEAVLILASFFQQFDMECPPARHKIALERNAVFTNRPVGVTVRVQPVRP